MFDHYIAVDWSQTNMAIARMTQKSNNVHVIDVPTDIKELKLYLSRLKGTKRLAVEESCPAQWLYTELRECVDDMIVCDPYRNHLLKEGPQNDKIDARKLCQLNRAGLLKPVFHTGDSLITLRKVVSGYIDVVKAGVRFQCQRKALFRANGGNNEEVITKESERFVLEGIERGIETYKVEKARYETEFKKMAKQYQNIRLLMSLPGIAEINSVKILATVVDPTRFATTGHFWGYCGLIDHKKISGGKVYGHRKPRYCRLLKGVFQNAALNAITDQKCPAMREYLHHLINEKKYSDSSAKNAVARRLAALSLGVLKSGQKFDPKRRATATLTH